MDIKIKIKKDVEDINKSFLPSFKTWQKALLFVAGIFLVLSVVIFYNIFNATESCLFSMFLIFLPCYLTFYKKSDLDFLCYIKAKKEMQAYVYETEFRPINELKKGKKHQNVKKSADDEVE